VAEQNDLEMLEELSYENNFLLNALIDVLTKKGLLTEEEIYERYDQLMAEIQADIEKQ
jgi:hypothetical protein